MAEEAIRSRILRHESSGALWNFWVRAAPLVIAASSAGILLAASFPPFDAAYLCWFALVPVLWATWGRGGKQSFCLGLLFGLCFLIISFFWMFSLPAYRTVHHGILGLYLGAYYGTWALGVNFLFRRIGPTSALVIAPFLWTALEYLRSNLSFLALPWMLLAHSQSRSLPFIQAASIMGAYGISFLIVLVNVALFAVILHARSRKDSSQTFLSVRTAVAFASVTAVMLGAVLIYGQWLFSCPIPGPQVKVAVVQGNIDQDNKWNPARARQIMDTYSQLTLKASKEGPDFIVWPECATPTSIYSNRWVYGTVKGLAKKTGAPLLLGSAINQKFHTQGNDKNTVNSAFLIHPGEQPDQRYNKVRLLPFGEYLPLKGIIPWSVIGIPDLGAHDPGSEFALFRTADFQFATTICWENIFPDMVRRFVREGAQFIVNITNEAWFGRSAAPHQFLSMSIFRAVENGVYVVRCANTGVSCVIDPRGRVVERVKDESGRDIFVSGVMTAPIIPISSKTVYTRLGDWPAWLSCIVSLIALLCCCRKIAGKGQNAGWGSQ